MNLLIVGGVAGGASAAACQVRQRGNHATRIRLQSGFSAVSESGGYKTHRLIHPSAT